MWILRIEELITIITIVWKAYLRYNYVHAKSVFFGTHLWGVLAFSSVCTGSMASHLSERVVFHICSMF